MESGDGWKTVIKKGEALRNSTIGHLSLSVKLRLCLLICWCWTGFTDGLFPSLVVMKDADGSQQENHQSCEEGGSDQTDGGSIGLGVMARHAFSEQGQVLPERIGFSICPRYALAAKMEHMRVLIVEDEVYLAEAIQAGLRLEAIAADIAGDGNSALELLSINSYDLAVLDRDIPGPSGDEIARHIVQSGSGIPILMLTAASRLDDKASGFELGADDYLTKPFELQELVLRLRALDRRRAHSRPPVQEMAGLQLNPFRREVYREGRYVPLTRKQFAVLEVLMQAGGGVVSPEELLRRAWDENTDPFTNAVRITVSALRKRLGEPWLIHTVPGVGYQMGTGPDPEHEETDGG